MRDLPSLAILIASVAVRHDQLVRLLDDLDRQAAPYMGNVSILVDRDDGQAAIGSKRNRLLLATRATRPRHVCFVDDDDRVHEDYVGRIMEALVTDPDYVGFKVAYTIDGYPQKPAIHSLENGEWSETDSAYLRGISHLNPIRREYALHGLPFLPGFGEDRDWADRVKKSGLVRREVFIDGAPMYTYAYSSSGSLFGRGGQARHVGSLPSLPSYRHVRLIGENG